MRVRIRERAQTIVVLLAGGIPEGQLDMLAVDLDVGDVVLEHGGNIHLEVCTCSFSTTGASTTALRAKTHLRESSLGEDDQKTGL